MANVNNFNTHYQETIKLTKAQSKMVRNLSNDSSFTESSREQSVKNFLDYKFDMVNTYANDKNELIVRVGAPNGLPSTYYFTFPTYKKA